MDNNNWGNGDWENQSNPDNSQDWQDNTDFGWDGQNQGQWDGQNQGFGNSGYEYQDNINNQYRDDSAYFGEQNYEDSNNRTKRNKKIKPPKERKHGGCLLAIIKFFLIIILLIIVAFIVIKAIKTKQHNDLIKQYESEVIVESPDSWKTRDYERESDIKGLTVREKLERGLSSANGSDTDGDGISDQLEIEKYNTNPLKVSSSGDFIPDGYKLKYNLDLTKSYTEAEAIEAGIDIFGVMPNIKFNDKTAENALLYVNEIDYTLDGVKADKAYRINGYWGNISVDFNEYIDDSKDQFIFKINDSIDSTVEKLKDKKGIVNTDIYGQSCVIGIINIDKLSFNSKLSGFTDISSNNEGFIVVLPITMITGEIKSLVFEQSVFGNKQDRSEELSKYLTEQLGMNTSVHHEYLDPISYSIRKSIFTTLSSGDFINRVIEKTDDNLSKADKESNKASLKRLMNFLILVEKFSNGDITSLFNTQDNDETEETLNKVTEVNNETGEINYRVPFDVGEDAFCFPNLGTVISPGGNCAGLSNIVVQMFNGLGYPAEAKQTFRETEYEYGLIQGKDTETLLDPGLHDYKDRTYWENSYGDTSVRELNTYKDSDKQFIKFIGYKWAEANSKPGSNLQLYLGQKPWSDMESIIDYFKTEDKVAYLSMLCPYAGHAIVCYGVYQDKDDPDVYWLRVWDCNFPDNKFAGKYPVDTRIKIIRQHHLFGDDTFEWDYYPLPEYLPKYRFTSYTLQSKGHIIRDLAQISELTLRDENFNTIG